jgi:hypothetical protein
MPLCRCAAKSAPVCAQECHKCKVMKPATDFYRNRTNNDGLYNNCKACFSQNSQRRQQTLPPMEQRMADSKVPAATRERCSRRGYPRQLHPRTPALQLIVTSASTRSNF